VGWGLLNDQLEAPSILKPTLNFKNLFPDLFPGLETAVNLVEGHHLVGTELVSCCKIGEIRARLSVMRQNKSLLFHNTSPAVDQSEGRRTFRDRSKAARRLALRGVRLG